MPKLIYSSGSANTKSHILTTESSHVLQGKQALIYFCSYFQKISLDQLEKDPLFICYMKQLCDNDPSIYTRAFH